MKTKLHHQSIPAYLDVYNSLYTDIVTGIYPPRRASSRRNISSRKIWRKSKYTPAGIGNFKRRRHDYQIPGERNCDCSSDQTEHR